MLTPGFSLGASYEGSSSHPPIITPPSLSTGGALIAEQAWLPLCLLSTSEHSCPFPQLFPKGEGGSQRFEAIHALCVSSSNPLQRSQLFCDRFQQLFFPFGKNLVIKIQRVSPERTAVALILSSNSPSSGLMTSSMAFLELETLGLLPGDRGHYIPSPAAGKAEVNAPAWLPGKTTQHSEKCSPEDIYHRAAVAP